MFRRSISSSVAIAAILLSSGFVFGTAKSVAADAGQAYEQKDTRQLVTFVNAAADLVRTRGEAAFKDFRVANSRWRHGESYIFVLDPNGMMLVHPDPALEGKYVLDLKDINGRPINRGIIAAVTADPDKPEAWYHYEWPVPGGLLPRWKSTYVRMVKAPSGKSYIVGSGIYNDRMERAFVVDMVKNAVVEIETHGKASFPLFHDPTGPFIAKDAYIFVYDMKGVNLVLPAFPNLEGRNLLDMKDTRGKLLLREMLQVVQTRGSGWVDYMWPKPGESVSTLKSAYVTKAKLGDQWVLVGSGVYLADAARSAPARPTMTAPQLMALVREAAVVFEKKGEQAYPEFRENPKWRRGDMYFFVWSMDGVRLFNAGFPESEGKNVRDIKDVKGRPFGRMILAAANSPSGEGWLHYMYPEPGQMFPQWKSTFVKRVTFPSGKQYAIGCGTYQLHMDKAFIEDVVDNASALVAAKGKQAFAELRDKTGAFVFMDTYVFVATPDGTELVNAGQPTLEGRNLIDLKDTRGKKMVREFIDVAMKNGSGWVEYNWYKPGTNAPARKRTYVKKVQSGPETYIVASGYYLD